MEMTWRKNSWQMRLLEMCLSYSRRPWQGRRWKLFLAFGSETQESLSPPILHGGVCGHVSSSSDQ